MFYAKYTDMNGNVVNKLYFSWDNYYSDTFCPLCGTIKIIEFKISGYSYQKRKAAARNLAIAWANTGDTNGLAWGDLCHISDFFYSVGKRFGLLREFRENGLC